MRYLNDKLHICDHDLSKIASDYVKESNNHNANATSFAEGAKWALRQVVHEATLPSDSRVFSIVVCDEEY